MRNPLVAAVILLIAGGNARGSYVYTITDLGGGRAYGINNNGQVVGQNAIGHAFLYANGIMTDLGTLGGSNSFALNINDGGIVVGWADNTDSTTQGFLYQNGKMSGLSRGALSGGAQGINGSGQVVGWYSNSGTTPAGAPLGPTQPFLYANGAKANLGNFPAGSDTFPLSINDSGQIIGYTYQPGVSGEQPFLIQNGTTTILNVSGAFQMINAGGQVVGGRYYSDTVRHAQLYSNGLLVDLGTFGGSNSWAYGINNAGEVVGDANTMSAADHAYLYRNGSMTDLNSLIDPRSGWTLETATAINDNGWIAGWGINATGQTDAFLLMPVPEPQSLTLLCFGGAVLACYGRRRIFAVMTWK